jgi:hypothetical protein
MTHVQREGWKIGDKFIVIRECDGFTKGQIVRLYEDQDDDMPLFKGTNKRYKHCDGLEGSYLHVREVIHLEESV